MLPDFTLPLVDMAEMDKPVMVVTVTDIRMMSHVRAAGRGHRFIPASPQPHRASLAPRTPSHHPTLDAAAVSVPPTKVFRAGMSPVPSSRL